MRGCRVQIVVNTSPTRQRGVVSTAGNTSPARVEVELFNMLADVFGFFRPTAFLNIAWGITPGSLEDTKCFGQRPYSMRKLGSTMTVGQDGW